MRKDWFDFEPADHCVPPCLLVTSDWWGVARLLVPAPGSRLLLVDPPRIPPPSYNSTLPHNTLTPGSGQGGEESRMSSSFIGKREETNFPKTYMWARCTWVWRWTSRENQTIKSDNLGYPKTHIWIWHYLKGTNETLVLSLECISWQ